MESEYYVDGIPEEELIKLAIYSAKFVIRFYYHQCRDLYDDLIQHALMFWYGTLSRRVDFKKFTACQVRAYIKETFRYRMINYCKKWLQGTGQAIEDLDLDNEGIMSISDFIEGRDALYYLEEKRKIFTLNEAIGGLPKKQRDALIKVDVEGMSNQEYAEIVGITESAATLRRKRAKENLLKSQKLKEYLQNE